MFTNILTSSDPDPHALQTDNEMNADHYKGKTQADLDRERSRGSDFRSTTPDGQRVPALQQVLTPMTQQLEVLVSDETIQGWAGEATVLKYIHAKPLNAHQVRDIYETDRQKRHAEAVRREELLVRLRRYAQHTQTCLSDQFKTLESDRCTCELASLLHELDSSSK